MHRQHCRLVRHCNVSNVAVTVVVVAAVVAVNAAGAFTVVVYIVTFAPLSEKLKPPLKSIAAAANDITLESSLSSSSTLAVCKRTSLPQSSSSAPLSALLNYNSALTSIRSSLLLLLSSSSSRSTTRSLLNLRSTKVISWSSVFSNQRLWSALWTDLKSSHHPTSSSSFYQRRSKQCWWNSIRFNLVLLLLTSKLGWTSKDRSDPIRSTDGHNTCTLRTKWAIIHSHPIEHVYSVVLP